MAEGIALYHHERWDGSGYSAGLVGEAIPMQARIAAVADVFDALTQERPYKRAWSTKAAMPRFSGTRSSGSTPES
jgi:putative two-component system response regulator